MKAVSDAITAIATAAGGRSRLPSSAAHYYHGRAAPAAAAAPASEVAFDVAWRRSVPLALQPYALDQRAAANASPFFRCFFRVPRGARGDFVANFRAECKQPIIAAVSLHVDGYEIIMSAHSEQWKATSAMSLARFTRAAPLHLAPDCEALFAVDVLALDGVATELRAEATQYRLDDDGGAGTDQPTPYPDLNLGWRRNGEAAPFTSTPLRPSYPIGRCVFVPVPYLGAGVAFVVPWSVAGVSSLRLQSLSDPEATRADEKSQTVPSLEINGAVMCLGESDRDSDAPAWNFPMHPLPVRSVLKNSKILVNVGSAVPMLIIFDNVQPKLGDDGTIAVSSTAWLELSASLGTVDH